ncbi:MAG: hypothetical protein JRH14_03785 [Deltaproteobacteria bacterium]|nr:hypothetical protein [Deltaproteobacteria bacterium]
MPRYRSHIALTVWPITALFVLELARMWPALRGASSFAAASPVTWPSLVAHTVAVLASLAAYVRGWSTLRLRSPTEAGPYRSEGCRRLQKLAGGLAWALAVAHLILRWFMTVRVGPVALSHYELLRGFLSHLPVLGFYALGLAALGLFLSQGLAASLRAWGLSRGAESSRWLEVGCTLASAVMVLMAINVLSHFVTGRAYWMGP